MESLESTTLVDYQVFAMGNKLFIFDTDIKYETYSNEWYYGIIFVLPNKGNKTFNKDGRYDVVHHHHMNWERLVINDHEGWKDIPFHAGTFHFLPEGIKVLEL